MYSKKQQYSNVRHQNNRISNFTYKCVEEVEVQVDKKVLCK